MIPPFPEWLALLAQANKGPVTLQPAVRGQAYTVTISYPGDVTTATLEGAVAASPDSPTKLAIFSVSAPEYQSLADRTVWTCTLASGAGANSTGALPADTDGNGVEYLLYDFIITLSGQNPERLFGGVLPVIGYITEAAE